MAQNRPEQPSAVDDSFASPTKSGYAPRFYVLDDAHNPHPATLDDYARQTTEEKRRVGSDYVGDVHVSTVFLGLDHRHWGGGPPILFETMIFGGKHDQYQERWETWADAEAGHQRAVEMVRDAL